MSKQFGAIIDWVSCTFFLGNQDPEFIVRNLARVTGLCLVAKERRSRPGFSDGWLIQAFKDYQLVDFAVLAWGGDSQRGRAMLDISGSSCGCITDWRMFESFLHSLEETRLTRVDVAVDLLDGEYTVDDCRQWYNDDKFTQRGRRPSSSLAGDWINEEEGRTLYVGKSKNGKALRCYEKGKQLGDKESPWVRFEVQFGNRDREIPFSILSDPSTYFVAAYPALEKMLEVAGERIKTTTKTTQVTIETIFNSLKNTYGKWIGAIHRSGVSVDDLVESMSLREIPRRIQAAALVADVLHPTICDAFSRWRNNYATQS